MELPQEGAQLARGQRAKAQVVFTDEPLQQRRRGDVFRVERVTHLVGFDCVGLELDDLQERPQPGAVIERLVGPMTAISSPVVRSSSSHSRNRETVQW